MTNIPVDVLTGFIIALAVVLGNIIVKLVEFFWLNPKKEDNGATTVLQKIQSNDMQHIEGALIEQNSILKHHTELLVKVVTYLEIMSKK